MLQRLAVLLALALGFKNVDAFQGPCIQQRRPASPPAHCRSRQTTNHVARPHQTRLDYPKLAATSNDDEDSDGDSLTSLRKRFKAYVKSSFSITSPSSDYDNADHEHHAKSPTQGLMEKEESYRKRLKHYLKAPYRYAKHYFADERQEELDGLGDIIVSDETPDEDEEDEAVRSTTAATREESSRTSLTSLRHLDRELDHGHHSSGEGMLDAAGSSAVATLTKEKEEDSPSLPVKSDRWAVAAPSVDLSGNWTIITTDSFKKSYDRYLALLGQPLIVRSVALSIVGLTTEETRQSEGGRKLWIRGKNARGVWERTLTASGADSDAAINDFTPVLTPIVTIDAEKVESEAWWENNGMVHRSWIRGVTKYGGGDFEAIRYLEQDGKVFVCETTFHPNDARRDKPQVTWKFLKDGETIN